VIHMQADSTYVPTHLIWPRQGL